MTAERFFSEEEKRTISAATSGVEARTSGEIAVMVVDSSDRYREAEITGGVVLSGLTALTLTELFFDPLVWYFIPIGILFFFPFVRLCGQLPVLKRAFVSAGRKNEAVAQRSLRAFYEKGLYHTRDNTGVLFFISLLEKKVWVLADKGIYERIDQETLNRYATTVTRGIKEGRSADALCSAIGEVGEILAKHFPVKPDDLNELSNEVMTE